MKEKLLISACLVGHNTKYNGKNNYKEEAEKLKEYFDFIVICPEVEGGLSTPRNPSEIVGNKVISNKGKDVTNEYKKGAKIALDRALSNNIKYALLKSKSPSCGRDFIYDGTFTSTLIEGNGIVCQLLLDNNIDVYTENEIDKLIDNVKNVTKI